MATLGSIARGRVGSFTITYIIAISACEKGCVWEEALAFKVLLLQVAFSAFVCSALLCSAFVLHIFAFRESAPPVWLLIYFVLCIRLT